MYADLSMTRHFHDDCCVLDAAALYRCGCLKPGEYVWEWRLPGSQQRSAAIVTEHDVVRIDNQFISLEWRPASQRAERYRCGDVRPAVSSATSSTARREVSGVAAGVGILGIGFGMRDGRHGRCVLWFRSVCR
jgi:hypothetical protein